MSEFLSLSKHMIAKNCFRDHPSPAEIFKQNDQKWSGHRWMYVLAFRCHYFFKKGFHFMSSFHVTRSFGSHSRLFWRNPLLVIPVLSVFVRVLFVPDNAEGRKTRPLCLLAICASLVFPIWLLFQLFNLKSLS